MGLERFAVQWCTDVSRAREISDFFAGNVETSYISHSELQGPRALDPKTWVDNLPVILRKEIRPRIAAIGRKGPAKTSKPVLVADYCGRLAGVSLVTFEGEAPVPFAIVEDIVVERRLRDQGIGKGIVDWIVREARSRGIRRLFLESGLTNKKAHHFFERRGFKTCSIVMMRSLDRSEP